MRVSLANLPDDADPAIARGVHTVLDELHSAYAAHSLDGGDGADGTDGADGADGAHEATTGRGPAQDPGKEALVQ